MNANLYALLRDHFAEHGEQPCILHPGGTVIHYDDLDAMAARIAHVLVAAGCERAIAWRPVDKCWQALRALPAPRAGSPPASETGYERARHFFGDAEPRVIPVVRPTPVAVGALRPEVTVLTPSGDRERCSISRATHPRPSIPSCRHGRPGAILYTSADRSQGRYHSSTSPASADLVNEWGFTRATLPHAPPVYHIHGLFVACHCALLSGSRMLWLPKFDAAEVLALLPHATVMMGVPTFYTRLLAEPGFTEDVCGSVRLFVSGSAPLLPETFNEFHARSGHEILERYGMSETGMNASNPPHGERICGSVGPPLPGVNVRVVDADGRLCSPGAVGGIEVKGPNVFAGYWRMPDKTRDEFTADGFKPETWANSWTTAI
jgi:malonyl-CoA/methylmalonyl-CoA synthetase